MSIYVRRTGAHAMHFASDDPIKAPAAFAFRDLTDFEHFEEQVRSRGAEITRLDTMIEAGVGVLWEVRFVLRGRRRKIDLKLSDFAEPEMLQLTGVSDGLLFVLRCTLEPEAADRCRFRTRLDVKPRNLAGRMMLQSARFTKPTLNRRYKARMKAFVTRVEERYAAPSAG
jgi:hypothetical protein